ncbi:MAG: cytochrome c biogenesis protein CcdA [Chloroflexi bacterium]|nr:cytochrome c biogenesis protein CcdA [Chloroflexota bacterium]
MTLAVAFLAGLVSCVSPCVLPVIPVFAGYVAGGAPPWAVASGAQAAGLAGTATWRAIGFLVGFLGVFVLLWASLGLVGFALLQAVPVLRQVSGTLIIAMGLLMIAGRHPMLGLARWIHPARTGAPVLLGAGVAVGWTPCIGPTLGAILTMAASAPSAAVGTLLLLAYALGLAVPFLLVLLAYRRFDRLVRWLAAHRRAVDVVTGGLVTVVGLLVFTGAFARLAGLFNFGIV